MITKSTTTISLLAIAFLISFLGCIIFSYLWIDRSISLAYLSASHDSTVMAYNKISSLLENEWRGISEQELRILLEAEINRQRDLNIIIDTNSEEGAVWFDEIKFEFELGKLKRIQ